MGGSISKMMSKIFGSKEMRLLMLGLDAAGKTSTYTLLFPTLVLVVWRSGWCAERKQGGGRVQVDGEVSGGGYRGFSAWK